MASVTLVADAGNTGGEGRRIASPPPEPFLAAGTAALAASVKRVLARHNVGRNTVEIVPPASDSPRGGALGGLEEGARGDDSGSRGRGGGRGDRGAFLAADESRSGHDEAERGQLGGAGGGGGGGGGGKSHGGHSHGHAPGQCSGHGHSHAHAAAVDLV